MTSGWVGGSGPWPKLTRQGGWRAGPGIGDDMRIRNWLERNSAPNGQSALPLTDILKATLRGFLPLSSPGSIARRRVRIACPTSLSGG